MNAGIPAFLPLEQLGGKMVGVGKRCIQWHITKTRKAISWMHNKRTKKKEKASQIDVTFHLCVTQQ